MAIASGDAWRGVVQMSVKSCFQAEWLHFTSSSMGLWGVVLAHSPAPCPAALGCPCERKIPEKARSMRLIKRSKPIGLTFSSQFFFCDHSLSLCTWLCVLHFYASTPVCSDNHLSALSGQMGRAVTFNPLSSASICGNYSLHLSINCMSSFLKKNARH